MSISFGLFLSLFHFFQLLCELFWCEGIVQRQKHHYQHGESKCKRAVQLPFMVVLVLKPALPFPIPLKNLYSFRQLPNQLKQRNQVSLLHLPEHNLLLRVRQKQEFHRVGEPSDLDLAVKAALIATDAVHNARNVVKPVLHVLEQRNYSFVFLVRKEFLLLEGVWTGGLKCLVHLFQELLHPLVLLILA